MMQIKASKLGVLEEKSEILFDPQTSGGLILAVEKSRSLEIVSSFIRRATIMLLSLESRFQKNVYG